MPRLRKRKIIQDFGIKANVSYIDPTEKHIVF
jgi:hypothetical protein